MEVIKQNLSFNDKGKFKPLSYGSNIEEQETLIEKLNNICIEWKDTFIIAEKAPTQYLTKMVFN